MTTTKGIVKALQDELETLRRRVGELEKYEVLYQSAVTNINKHCEDKEVLRQELSTLRQSHGELVEALSRIVDGIPIS